MSHTITLADYLQKALDSQHPWIYRNHLNLKQVGQLARLRPGQWVQVRAGTSHAWGLYDDDSAIALRLYSWEAQPPTSEWFDKRVSEALEARASLHASSSNAYRLINGENDYLPGLIADRYDRFVVLKLYQAQMRPFLPAIVKALHQHSPFRIKGIVERLESELQTHYGELPPPELTIREHDVQMLVNPYEGQKTGLFLDHRENRRTMQPLCDGLEVLNLFAYSGAFSLYALAGGASQVVSVDSAEPALADAVRNVELNAFSSARHHIIPSDCYKVMQDYHTKGKQFDVVIIDPPSLAKNKNSRQAAARAYRKLNKAALRCVAPGGMLASASCTAQISPEHFVTILGEAASEANRRVQLVHEAGQALDHPVRAGFMEGRYLKFVLARVL